MTGIEQEKAAAWIPPARSHAHDAVPADSHSTASSSVGSSSGASSSGASSSVSSNSTALRSVDSHSGAVFAVASSSVDLAAARAGTAAPVVAFARRPLAALLSASLISLLGTAMSQLAIPWMVLTTTGSAARTGTVAFAETAPYVALQALAGPLVDRLGARRACIAGNAAAAPVVCAIPALYAAGLLPLGALAALVGVAGAVRGLADCAANVLVPGAAKVGGVPLERAAGLSTGAGRAGLVLGAPLAGILITAAGAPVVVLADGITFAVAALLIAALLPTEIAAPATAPSDRGYLGQLGEGLRFIRTDRLLVGIIAMVAVANLLDQGLSAVLLPVWVRSHLHSPSSLGLIAGAMEIGALIGNIAGAWLGPRLPRRATYSVGWLLSGAPRFAVLVLAGTLSPILAVFAFVGLSGGAINPIIGALSYERVPPHLHARVLGTIKASAWIGIPFGSLIAGALTETVGLRATLIAAGATYFATTLAPFVSPTWHGMDHRPPPAPPGPV
ncbi:MAG TPA: MFS transporter [Actinocrinis sp.]|uniref:MFS transporter n=1 Tax=Actinocrinis sp. TaxID=1920516 RepID=UPI002DDD5707|nr:MFS transporter [Actinocrinis sp.]HEV3169513.1 MFS transporter [Actinocrinis sp.]